LRLGQHAVGFSSARTLLRGYHKTKLTANSCIARCNSTNAVNISSATDGETLSVAMSINNPDCVPFKVES